MRWFNWTGIKKKVIFCFVYTVCKLLFKKLFCYLYFCLIKYLIVFDIFSPLKLFKSNNKPKEKKKSWLIYGVTRQKHWELVLWLKDMFSNQLLSTWWATLTRSLPVRQQRLSNIYKAHRICRWHLPDWCFTSHIVHSHVRNYRHMWHIVNTSLFQLGWWLHHAI